MESFDARFLVEIYIFRWLIIYLHVDLDQIGGKGSLQEL